MCVNPSLKCFYVLAYLKEVTQRLRVEYLVLLPQVHLLLEALDSVLVGIVVSKVVVVVIEVLDYSVVAVAVMEMLNCPKVVSH